MITFLIIFALACFFICLFEFISLLFNWSLRAWIKARRKKKGSDNEEDIWIDFIDLSDSPGRDHDHAGGKQ